MLEKLHCKMEIDVLYNNRPSERDEKVCVVDEAALQRKDWEQIRYFLPNCSRYYRSISGSAAQAGHTASKNAYTYLIFLNYIFYMMLL